MTTTMPRALLFAAALLAAAPGAARATRGESPLQIQWEQLVPGGGAAASGQAPPRGVVQHGQLGGSTASNPLIASAPAGQPEGSAPVVTEFDGKAVRIDGFVLPLEFDGTAVKEFLLVPYVGACIHVPPPPANQIIHVRSGEGVTVRGMFDPVTVTGTLTAASVATELADAGYRIAADTVVPFVERRPRFAFEKYLSRKP